jgi:hypothetical protein
MIEITMLQRILIIFFLLIAAGTSNAQSDLALPFTLLNPGQFTLEARSGLFMEEHEYEKAKVVQDLFEYEHYFYKMGSTIGLSGKRQIGIELTALSNGELSKQYSPTLNLQSQNISYKGFYSAEFFFQQHFETGDDKNKLAFELRTKGSPLKGKETNNTYQGKDISMSLLFSHLHNGVWRMYGDLHAEIIGKKKTIKYEGEEEVVSPYSQFGNLIGIQWLQEKFWLEINGLFYLTTDYNSQSKSYTRLTDKGFVVGGKILAGYYVTPSVIMTIDHTRKGSNFNVITESTTEATEFEIETQYTQLGVIWVF